MYNVHVCLHGHACVLLNVLPTFLLTNVHVHTVGSFQPGHSNLQNCKTLDQVCSRPQFLPTEKFMGLRINLCFGIFADIKRPSACTQAVQQKYAWVLLHATLG